MVGGSEYYDDPGSKKAELLDVKSNKWSTISDYPFVEDTNFFLRVPFSFDV